MSAPAIDPPGRPAAFAGERIVIAVALSFVLLWLLVTVVAPLAVLLAKSFQNADGVFVGLANYARYAATPALVNSLVNTLAVGLATTAIVIPLAFVYAFALTRACIPARGLFQALALLPIFAPSLLPAISLIYLFGNQGMLKDLLFGETIYGPIGIVMAQAIYCFPFATMILATALALADARLYEAAEAMGTSMRRVFLTLTLPGAKFGLVSASFIVFTLVVTDFGIPKVIGGQFAVLATDAYKQVIGQQNFQMGAVVGMILLAPAILAFVADRIVQRRNHAALTSRAVPLVPKPRAARDIGLTLYCVVVAGALAGVFGVAVWASFITYWPYNLTPTLRNYVFENFDADGWQPFFNSLAMAANAAVIGTAIVFGAAWMVEKVPGFRAMRTAVHFVAMLPMAVPGLVLGLGYVFFVNAPWNPLSALYATLAILIVNSIAHFYTVAHMTALTQLKQIDPEFESVSASLKVPLWRTFWRVTVPISMPAVLDIAVYLFVNAMTTVSSVIFLYGANTKLASIAVVHMDEAGATAAAAAMASLIMATALAVKLVHVTLDRLVFQRLQAWRRR